MPHKCFYCPSPATTKDHIVPVSYGKKHIPHNTVPACKLCNTTRNNMPQQDFIRFMQFVTDKGLVFSKCSRSIRRALKQEFLNKTGIRVGGLHVIIEEPVLVTAQVATAE